MTLVEFSPAKERRYGPVSHSERDWCNKEGASALAERIRNYWSERGFSVEIKLKESGFLPSMRAARVDLRSDIVNGKPTRRLASSQEQAA